MADKSNGCEGLVATPDIKSVKDLKGKTVATQYYSVDHMFLLTLLEENGMSVDDINLVDMTIENAGNAFVAGQCDAACIWDPYFSKAKDAGGTVLYSTADNPDLISDIVATSSKMIEEKPEVVQAMVKSYYEAVAYWKEHPEESNKFMADKMDVTVDEFESQMVGLIVLDAAQTVALIHFDAHYDTIPEYFGKPYNHGTPFHHAAIEGLVDTSHSIHVGIREGLYSPADSAHSEELGYECLNAHIMHQMSMQDVVKKICDRVGDKKAFVTFDIDFLDPAYAPGTGTPVPGGFSTAQAYELVRGLKDLNIVGYDMVEVSPPYDPTQATSIAAAGIMQEFLSQIAYRKRKNS